MPVLNTADKLYLGGTPVAAMYQGATKVWPSWKPSALAGLKLWLDAAPLVSGPLPTWFDLSGNGSNSTLVTDANLPFPPAVRANALNGKPVVRFRINEGRFRWNG